MSVTGIEKLDEQTKNITSSSKTTRNDQIGCLSNEIFINMALIMVPTIPS
jgi:hypothetical protein